MNKDRKVCFCPNEKKNVILSYEPMFAGAIEDKASRNIQGKRICSERKPTCQERGCLLFEE